MSAGESDGITITAGTPQEFTHRNVGVELKVTPTVEEDDYSISLDLNPKVTEFEGFVEYGGPSVAIETVSGGVTYSASHVSAELRLHREQVVVQLLPEHTATLGDPLEIFATLVYPDDVAAFRAGLKKLKTYEYVDPANVFVFSHSSGGAIASMLAEEGVRGIATFAAFARPWKEHTMDQTMREWKLGLLKEDEIKANLEKEKIIADELYVKKHSPKEMFEAHPELKEYLGQAVQGDNMIYGMPYKYLQQLAGMDLAAAWAKVNAPVLAMWGEADYAASKADSELIASIVNKKVTGKGKFVSLPGTDHSFAKAEDQEESFLAAPGGGGKFNPIVMETLINWLREQMGSKSS